MTAPAAWTGYKALAYGRLELVPGDQVLDVGCGTGEDARELARLHPGVEIVGVDRDEARVAEAERLTLGVPRPVAFRAADAHRLPFDAATFDAARADRVLHHVDDPPRAVRELARVTRPGGRVVVTDPDYETLVVEGADPGTGRRIAGRHADRLPHGRIGRRLRGLALDAGLADVEVVAWTGVAVAYDEDVLALADKAREAAAAGVIGPAEAEAWVAALEAADRAGRFLCALTWFTARGRVR